MREIKFRVWNPRLKEMSEPFTIQSLLSAEVRLLHKTTHDEPIFWMQYTGLKDKQGKEIYEGDILKFEVVAEYDDDRYVSVFWNEDEGMWDIKPISKLQYHDRFSWLKQNSEFKTRTEIAGNIYENSELLKKE